jgi:uncharacterized phage infection (PIP) family protein YhgE
LTKHHKAHNNLISNYKNIERKNTKTKNTMPLSVTVPVLSLQDLVQLSQEHQTHIEEIKNEVAQEVHNLGETTPLFGQLSDEK